MDDNDIHEPFAHRPRKQSLSAIIERIVLQKQRQKEKAIFQSHVNAGMFKIEPCELIDDTMQEPGSSLTSEQLATSTPPQERDSQTAEGAQVAAQAAATSASQEDDEELEDEDSSEREDANIDPERLKAFNLFVRLFVDEQLDRTIPISRQPKERIQTIIDSCCRQFPEFGDRARKRLRTYLKACRRHKKLREPLSVSDVGALSGGLGRVTPAPAEVILAQACHNETRSAKRRQLAPPESAAAQPEGGDELMQLSSMIPPEPTAAEDSGSCTPTPAQAQDPATAPAPTPTLASAPTPALAPTPYTPASTSAPAPTPTWTPAPTPSWVPAPAPGPERAYTQAAPVSSMLGGQPASSAFYQADVSHLLRQTLPSCAGGPPSHTTAGDLFFRRARNTPLNLAEAVAVRTLVDGYRQSASLLRRTADELEALIPHRML